MSTGEAEFERLVDAWIAAEGTSERESSWWAVSEELDWGLGGEPESLWRFVLAAYRREMSDRAFACLAAGPLEDLLSRHGPQYIDRVEELARRDSRFNYLLGGVWHLDMTDDVWARVQAVRRSVW